MDESEPIDLEKELGLTPELVTLLKEQMLCSFSHGVKHANEIMSADVPRELKHIYGLIRILINYCTQRDIHLYCFVDGSQCKAFNGAKSSALTLGNSDLSARRDLAETLAHLFRLYETSPQTGQAICEELTLFMRGVATEDFPDPPVH